MKAIIITDVDARALLDKLELKKLQTERLISGDPTRAAMVDDAHRAFHYVVCRWLQEQGADVVGR
jgi:hypothetical protein